MSPVTLFLISLAAIFLIGTFGEVVFSRTKVPDVVWLIVVGIFLGPVLHIVTRETLLSIAPYFSALTLVLVLFEGGSRLDLVQLYRAAARSVLLSVLSFIFSATAVTLVSRIMVEAGLLPGYWDWHQELLIGLIVGGTSPIVIMAAIARAGVPPEAANLISLESAISDVLCIVAVSSFIGIVKSGQVGDGPWLDLLRSFGLGILIGIAGGMLWLLLMEWLKENEHAYPITLSALLLLYVIVEAVGGSGALGVLSFAVVVGNASHIGRQVNISRDLQLHDDLRGFHSQMFFIIKSFFFTFVGAMLGPPWALATAGAVLAAVLLVARYPAAWLAMLHSTLQPRQRHIVFMSVPRGVAAGVLATLPLAAGLPGMAELPTVVFACVVGTILLFATGFPLVMRGAPPAEQGTAP
jgi:cell volume regulation protein A